MRNIRLTCILIIGLALFSCPGFADEMNWEQEFVETLQQGKIKTTGQGEGLGYTPSEGTVLETAIKKAMELEAPPCEAMKIAVDLEYNPYSVIKNIFGYGSQVNLNQLCMCATESGINKQIVAKAASEATSPIGTPVFPRDEITQAQCLKDIGLGYTASAAMPERILPSPKPPNFSVSSP